MKELLKKLFGVGFREWKHGGETFFYLLTTEEGRLHMSISGPARNLTYDEIKAARYELMPGDKHIAMIFPPMKEFVNVHEHCFHLWEI